MRTPLRLLLLAGSTFLSAHPAPLQDPPEEHAVRSDNPFFSQSSLPYRAPRFDQIRFEHYAPAFEEGMRRQIAEIEAIAASKDAPTFANTIEALERSGTLLARVAPVFFALAQADTNERIQALQAELSPKLAAHRDRILMDRALFARVADLHRRRSDLGLSGEQMAVLERWFRDFQRAGAELDDARKDRLRAINREISTLVTEFQRMLLEATNASAVRVENQTRLRGLSEGDLARAVAAAEGLGCKALLTLRNTTQQPVLASLADRDLRRQVLQASRSRGKHGPTDTRPLILKLARLRAEKASLFGFSCYADYVLDDQMAKTARAAKALLAEVAKPALAKARAEAARLQELIDREQEPFRLSAEDWQYYAERARKTSLALDADEVRSYFVLDRVLEGGLFFMARELYGLEFRERKDIPVYREGVRVFEVFGPDGEGIGLFYTDYFARPSKAGGAWMDGFATASRMLGQKPIVYNVCNFDEPAEGQPALLSYDDVTTMFHEFGHALHGLLGRTQYPLLSGTNVPRDFVELPSQFHEHWALDPRVLANCARHWKTGAPMPQDLVDKLRRAQTFDSGFATVEYLMAAVLDMAWHSLPPDRVPSDVERFEEQALQDAGFDIAAIPPRYGTTYFRHIWGGDYAAGYYAYLWAEVLDQDAFAWFTEHGGMTRPNGARFEQAILSRGGTREAGAMFREFRGRDPSSEPLLKARGLLPGGGG